MKKDNYIFFDRDGTIIKDGGYTHKKEDLEFLPGATEGLQQLQALGYRFVIVTNQAGVAHGHFTAEQAHEFNTEIVRRLAEKGIRIEQTYMCFHHPSYGHNCLCRKPRPGMVLQAVQEFGMDPSQCLFVGDKDTDVELGRYFNTRTFLVKNGQYKTESKPDHIIKRLDEIPIILGL
jgi:D-glycero-D-manno-heptose 1,7-bisphosphate phosphatase